MFRIKTERNFEGGKELHHLNSHICKNVYAVFTEGLFPLTHDTENRRRDMVKGCLVIKNQIHAPNPKSQRALKWKTTGGTGACD